MLISINTVCTGLTSKLNIDDLLGTLRSLFLFFIFHNKRSEHGLEISPLLALGFVRHGFLRVGRAAAVIYIYIYIYICIHVLRSYEIT
jgi:hypothetical protein